MDHSIAPTTRLEHRIALPLWSIAAVTFALLVVGLWLPFGINISDFSDTWVLYHALEQGTLPLINLQDSRLFYAFGYYIPYVITPNSFIGANLFLMALMWGKAFVLYSILRQLLPQLPQVAFFVGVLALVFPADTGTFWITSMNVNLPIFLYLLSVCILVWFWQKPHWLKLIGMWLALAVAFTYEANYLLILVKPITLVWLEERVSKPVLWVSGLWFVVPVIMFSRLILLYTQGGGFEYQQAVLQTGLSGENVLQNMLNSLIRIYQRSTAFIWVESVETMRATFDPRFALVAASAAMVSIITGSLHIIRGDERLHGRVNALLVVGGLAIIGLGFAPYLPTEFRDTNYRNLFLPALGGAICLTSLLYLVAYSPLTIRRVLFLVCMSTWFGFSSRLPILMAMGGGLALMLLPRRTVFALAAGGIVFIGMYALLRQHQLYAEMPLRQQWIMEAMVRQAPALDENAFMVLLDDTPDLRGLHAFEWRRDVFIAALAFLYRQPALRSAFCVPSQEVWGFWHERCAFREDGLWISWDRGEEVIPYQNLVLFRYSDTEGAELLEEVPIDLIASSATADYVPHARIDSTAPLPSRLYTLFAHVPFREQPIWVEYDALR